MVTRLASWALVAAALVAGENHHHHHTYDELRRAELAAEAQNLVGGAVALTAVERAADAVLRAAKAADLVAEPPLPAVHFFEAKARLEAGGVFPLIRSLPKGGALHVHSDAMVGAEWLVANATYDPTLWICGAIAAGPDRDFRLAFSERAPWSRPVAPDACLHADGWRKVVDLRAAATSAADFDADLVAGLTLVPRDVAAGTRPYATLDEVWKAFDGAFGAVDGLVYYDEFHTAYLREAFRIFADDGVSVLELRHLVEGGRGVTYLRRSLFSLLPRSDRRPSG
jgi:hypothetical protein